VAARLHEAEADLLLAYDTVTVRVWVYECMCEGAFVFIGV